MRCVNLLLAGVLAVAAAAGCYTGAHVEPNKVSTTPTTTTNGTDPASIETGLPCNVGALIAEQCGGCHSDPPKNGATVRIMTRDDLLAPEKIGSDQTIAAIALERMKNAKDPMPPTGVLADSDIAILENWLASGAEAATCADVIPAGIDPYDTPSVCTSNAFWKKKDDGNEKMHPGGTCISCHTDQKSNKREGDEDEAPIYTIAGTVFPTAHEPDDCNGAASVKVEITGADGKKTTLTTNTVGNFFSKATIKFPYTARIIGADGSTRAMTGKQTDGDCNGCHTELGRQEGAGTHHGPHRGDHPVNLRERLRVPAERRDDQVGVAKVSGNLSFFGRSAAVRNLHRCDSVRLSIALATSVLSAVLIACSVSNALPSANLVDPSGAPIRGESTPVVTNLPCDVESVLAKNCQSCHSATPKYGAPMPLVTHDDLVNASLEPGKKVYEEVGLRIHDDLHPMPQAPNPRLSAADTATLDAWIASGAPAASATCATTTVQTGADPLSCAPDQVIRPASSFVMTDASDLYVCYGFDTAATEKRHVIEGGPHIDNPNIVHHVLLYQSDEAVSNTPTPCGAGGSTKWRLVTGWAPGGKNFKLPPEAGFAEESGTTHWAVQIHYNNVKGLKNQVDGTGYDLCTTNQLRPNDADILATGTVQINIPPRSTFKTDCDLAFPESYGTIKVISSWPHMHKLGRDQEASRVRDNVSTPLVSAPTYDFSTGATATTLDVDLAAGDHIRTSCMWSNPTDSSVKFGEATEDEMCFAFLTYYPQNHRPDLQLEGPCSPERQQVHDIDDCESLI